MPTALANEINDAIHKPPLHNITRNELRGMSAIQVTVASNIWES